MKVSMFVRKRISFLSSFTRTSHADPRLTAAQALNVAYNGAPRPRSDPVAPGTQDYFLCLARRGHGRSSARPNERFPLHTK